MNRNQRLRLFLLHCRNQSQPHVSQQVLLSTPVRQFTSFPNQSHFLSHFFTNPQKPNQDNEINSYLNSNNVILTHDLILTILRDLNTKPDAALRFLKCVLDNYSDKLSSESYNVMLQVLGCNGFVKETLDLINVMKKKGYVVEKATFCKIYETFKKDGLSDDMVKLSEFNDPGSVENRKFEVGFENSAEKICSWIIELVKSDVWGEELEMWLRGLDVELSSGMVRAVLESLEMEPEKALMFFKCVEENGLFEHDQQTYNTVVVVLSRQETTESFWSVVNEMRSKGHEMDRETYVKLLNRFVYVKLMNDAVDLYQFAMSSKMNKPSEQDCGFLLKNIAEEKELDMDLYLKVISAFKAGGNELTNSHLDVVLKSLTSVGRITDCNKILKAMETRGYLPRAPSQSKIAFKLSSTGRKKEAYQFMENMAASSRKEESGTWVSLFTGYCVARDLGGATRSFREMVEDKEASSVGCALDLLICTYCLENRPLDAYKLISEMVKEKGLSPWCTTFKALTRKLLVNKHFKEALEVMKIMKNQGHAPDLDAFVGYLSKTASAEDSITFLQVMTSKKYPSSQNRFAGNVRLCFPSLLPLNSSMFSQNVMLLLTHGTIEFTSNAISTIPSNHVNSQVTRIAQFWFISLLLASTNILSSYT